MSERKKLIKEAFIICVIFSVIVMVLGSTIGLGTTKGTILQVLTLAVLYCFSILLAGVFGYKLRGLMVREKLLYPLEGLIILLPQASKRNIGIIIGRRSTNFELDESFDGNEFEEMRLELSDQLTQKPTIFLTALIRVFQEKVFPEIQKRDE